MEPAGGGPPKQAHKIGDTLVLAAPAHTGMPAGAKVIINGTWVGCFGEVDPAVASLHDLRVPLNGAEFDVDALMSAVQDPV